MVGTWICMGSDMLKATMAYVSS